MVVLGKKPHRMSKIPGYFQLVCWPWQFQRCGEPEPHSEVLTRCCWAVCLWDPCSMGAGCTLSLMECAAVLLAWG